MLLGKHEGLDFYMQILQKIVIFKSIIIVIVTRNGNRQKMGIILFESLIKKFAIFLNTKIILIQKDIV